MVVQVASEESGFDLRRHGTGKGFDEEREGDGRVSDAFYTLENFLLFQDEGKGSRFMINCITSNGIRLPSA